MRTLLTFPGLDKSHPFTVNFYQEDILVWECYEDRTRFYLKNEIVVCALVNYNEWLKNHAENITDISRTR